MDPFRTSMGWACLGFGIAIEALPVAARADLGRSGANLTQQQWRVQDYARGAARARHAGVRRSPLSRATLGLFGRDDRFVVARRSPLSALSRGRYGRTT